MGKRADIINSGLWIAKRTIPGVSIAIRRTALEIFAKNRDDSFIVSFSCQNVILSAFLKEVSTKIQYHTASFQVTTYK